MLCAWIDQPNVRCASTRSPSVTATSRMLSPKRATRRRREVCQPRAAESHDAIRLRVAGSLTWPAITLRRIPRRVQM